MRRASIAIMIGVVAISAACAHLLGFDDARGRFDHRAHLLEGIACVQCHVGVERAGERGPLHLPGDALCLTCHEEPHDARPCLSCHGEATTRVRAAATRDRLRFEHARHLDRNPGQCVRCHTGVTGAAESMAAPMALCFSCHEHQGQQRARDCGACHVDLAAEGITPAEHFIHDLGFERRHGVQARSGADLCAACHKERDCAACHGVTAPTLPGRVAFDDPLRLRLHRAGFLARHALEARASGDLCATCHAPSFCASCHQRQRVHPTAGARSPHPAGWLRAHGPQARREPVACASCHDGTGEQLCVGCHRVGQAGGSIHPPGWSSRKPMADLPCRRCHIP